MELAIQILAQFFVTAGLLIWLTKRHADKLDKLVEDIAIIKTVTIGVRDDHDKLIILEQRVNKTDFDVNHAFELLRKTQKNDYNGKDSKREKAR